MRECMCTETATYHEDEEKKASGEAPCIYVPYGLMFLFYRHLVILLSVDDMADRPGYCQLHHVIVTAL